MFEVGVIIKKGSPASSLKAIVFKKHNLGCLHCHWKIIWNLHLKVNPHDSKGNYFITLRVNENLLVLGWRRYEGHQQAGKSEVTYWAFFGSRKTHLPSTKLDSISIDTFLNIFGNQQLKTQQTDIFVFVKCFSEAISCHATWKIWHLKRWSIFKIKDTCCRADNPAEISSISLLPDWEKNSKFPKAGEKSRVWVTILSF